MNGAQRGTSSFSSRNSFGRTLGFLYETLIPYEGEIPCHASILINFEGEKELQEKLCFQFVVARGS